MNVAIKNLQREQDTGGVISVVWCATKHDGEYSAEVTGTRFFTPDPDSSNFVPFEKLSEDDVIGWLNIDDVWTAFIEEKLNDQIEEQKNPPIQEGLPWDQSEEQS